MQKGKFIVFEGIDGSGKKTQSALLKDALERKGLSVNLIDFPQYRSTFGQLVASYLKGEFGPKESVEPEIHAMLYAIDRYQFKDIIFSNLEKGKWYIADRYTQSNMGFVGSRLCGKESQDIIDWIQCVESRLPKPDIVIFLNTTVEISQKHLSKREQKHGGIGKDIHESDDSYQKKVAETYIEIARQKGFDIVECANNGFLKAPQEIHNDILDIVNERFRLKR